MRGHPPPTLRDGGPECPNRHVGCPVVAQGVPAGDSAVRADDATQSQPTPKRSPLQKAPGCQSSSQETRLESSRDSSSAGSWKYTQGRPRSGRSPGVHRGCLAVKPRVSVS